MAKGTTALFLRGINVGGRHKVSMDDLRAVLDDLGLGPSRTHLQSGNAIVICTPGARVEKKVSEALADEFEFPVPVATRSAAEMASIVKHNPFAKPAAKDPASVHVHFLSAEPDAAKVEAVDPERWATEDWVVAGRELYVHYRQGAGRSKLTAGDIERQLGVISTGRNWKTVTAMADLVQAEA